MKIAVIVGVLLLIGLILGLTVMGTYNGLVEKDTKAVKAWADVEAAYQRRLDTIPNFVKVAKFSAEFQIKLATEYAKVREGVSEAATTGSPGALQARANEGFNGLMIAVRAEAAVEAKTDQLTELNAEIENIERVINHERKAYNDTVQVYNYAIRKVIPAAFISWFGWDFQPMESFEAQEGAEQAPEWELK